VLGYEDLDADVHGQHVMADTLRAGRRRLPAGDPSGHNEIVPTRLGHAWHNGIGLPSLVGHALYDEIGPFARTESGLATVLLWPNFHLSHVTSSPAYDFVHWNGNARRSKSALGDEMITPSRPLGFDDAVEALFTAWGETENELEEDTEPEDT
jgi:hypothetical protein